MISCPKNYVIVGRAASNRKEKAEHNGKRYATYIKCCKALSERLMAGEENVGLVKDNSVAVIDKSTARASSNYEDKYPASNVLEGKHCHTDAGIGQWWEV